MTTVARKARPSFFGVELDAVSSHLLKGTPGTDKFEAKVDGVSGSGQTRVGRKRRGSTEPLPFAPAQWAEKIACFSPLWELAALLDAELNHDLRSGRPRECLTVECLIFEIVTWVTGSYRQTELLFKDRHTWQRMSVSVAFAYQGDSTRRLSSRPISRAQFGRLRDTIVFDGHLEEMTRDFVDALSHTAALYIGMFDPGAGSFSHPHGSQVIVGDGTWMPGKFNSVAGEPIVDKDTGEIIGRTRFDPNVRSYHDTNRGAGYPIMIASGRTMFPHERIVLFLDEVPKGTTDGQHFAERIPDYAFKTPGLLAASYDMSVLGPEVQKILDAGVLPVVKVPRWTRGRIAHSQIEKMNFTLTDGREVEMMVWAVDGTPSIEVVVEGEKRVQPLERVHNKRQRNKSGWRVYGQWKIPAKGSVPPHLHNATTFLRYQTTRSDVKSGVKRTAFLRPIPESDGDFAYLYGRREDTESTHHHMKSKLTDRRSRCVGRERNLHHMRGYQVLTVVTALMAHGLRTGDHSPRWFGDLPNLERLRNKAA